LFRQAFGARNGSKTWRCGRGQQLGDAVKRSPVIGRLASQVCVGLRSALMVNAGPLGRFGCFGLGLCRGCQDLSANTVFAYELLPQPRVPLRYALPGLLQRPFDGRDGRFALAQAMKEMTRRTDAYWRPADIVQHQFAGAPSGSAYVCISPGEQGEFASSNGNRGGASLAGGPFVAQRRPPAEGDLWGVS
jgi:hypothetical protein